MSKENQFINISNIQGKIYLQLIELLFSKCTMFVIADEYDSLDSFATQLNESIMNTHYSKSWLGTKSSHKAKIHKFVCDHNSKSLFKKYTCFITEKDNAYLTFNEDIQVDISFFTKNDNSEKCVLYTTTHEGNVFLLKKLYNELIQTKIN